MSRQSKWLKSLRGTCAAAFLAILPLGGPAMADTVAVTGGAAVGESGDGTMSAAARQSMMHGALPASAADVAAKAAADAAYDAATAKAAAATAAELAASGGTQRAGRTPVIASGFAGQFDTGGTPPDTTGATGTTRYVQTVNRKFGIYDRVSSVALGQGTLNQLAGLAGTVNSFDPQIIWDTTTNRFYYAMDSIFSGSDNRIAFGFSKSSSPNSAADFCKYSISNYGSLFPDFPKLGDNRFFILVGVNVYAGSYLRSDIIALPKPIGTGTIATCPTFTQLMNGRGVIFQNILDNTGQRVFSPAPANSIDTNPFGYAVGRNLSLPSTKLWIVPINGPATGLPTISATRVVNIPTTTVPASARQPSFTQLLDTSDTRMTQAVMARNPARANALSLWTQQTIPNTATGSQVQFYEIRPDVAAPILQRTGKIAGAATSFLFNAAISPDRRLTDLTTGSNFVVGYSVSAPTINARIVAGSSINGAAPTFQTVKNGAGPYRDFSCAGAFQVCRWGDYAGATPDPVPQGGAASAVGLTNQYSPGGAMPTTQANWRTWIFHVRP
jgi:hypothetical protein